jgi:hypothetical protein
MTRRAFLCLTLTSLATAAASQTPPRQTVVKAATSDHALAVG